MEDCFFFIDYEVPEEERKMSVCCLECKIEHYPDTDMYFHLGSKEGYGPFDYKCCKCGKLVHSIEEHDEYEEDEIETPD